VRLYLFLNVLDSRPVFATGVKGTCWSDSNADHIMAGTVGLVHKVPIIPIHTVMSLFLPQT
jgi:hypothetical protein